MLLSTDSARQFVFRLVGLDHTSVVAAKPTTPRLTHSRRPRYLATARRLRMKWTCSQLAGQLPSPLACPPPPPRWTNVFPLGQNCVVQRPCRPQSRELDSTITSGASTDNQTRSATGWQGGGLGREDRGGPDALERRGKRRERIQSPPCRRDARAGTLGRGEGVTGIPV